jgi:hypothetical protein
MVVASAPVAVTAKPPDTDTVLVTGDVAFAETFTHTVMGGYADPAASPSLRLQVAPVHDQPLPVIETKVNPVGSVSVTVRVPEVGPPAEFDTTTVYAALSCPATKLPECVQEILRTKGGVPVTVSVTGTVTPPEDTL